MIQKTIFKLKTIHKKKRNYKRFEIIRDLKLMKTKRIFYRDEMANFLKTAVK